MCIYCGTAEYRKIYERHTGPIPRDQDGRSYEIHHLDGRHHNNDPTNLIAVSINDHYDIHYSQGDWAACHRIAAKMKIPYPELSAMLSELAVKMNAERIKNGTHNRLNSEAQRAIAIKGIKSGANKFVGAAMNKKLMESGNHPSQVPWTCLCCKFTGKGLGAFTKHHGDNCRAKIAT